MKKIKVKRNLRKRKRKIESIKFFAVQCEKELSLIIKLGSFLVPFLGEIDKCQDISDTRCQGNQIQLRV